MFYFMNLKCQRFSFEVLHYAPDHNVFKWTNFNEILIKIRIIVSREMHLKTLTAKWGPSIVCNLNHYEFVRIK